MKNIGIKFLVTALALTMVVGFAAGCKPEEPDVFQVAGLFPGPVTDGGWSQIGYQALQAVETELGAEISYMENVASADMASAMRDYASRGYDMVIGHSFEFQDAAVTVSGEYPDTFFMTSGGLKFTDNYFPIEIATEQVAYLFGMIAGHMSETGKAGCIGSKEIPSIAKTFVGFEAGAKRVNPDFEVSVTFVGAHDDVSGGYEAAMAFIDGGADFLFENANATGLGVIQAAVEKDIYVYGMSTDKSSLAPENLIASDVIDIGSAFVAMARRVMEGNLGTPGVQYMGLNEGAVKLVWNEALKQTLPQEVLDDVQAAYDEITSGTLVVPTN